MLTLLLAVNPASATTYNAELAVPSQFPSWRDSSAEYGSSRILAAVTHADIVVNSDHPTVTCEIADNKVIVHMAANAADYPSSFPYTANCVLGSDKLVVDVVTFNAASDPSLQTPQIVNDALSVTRVEDSLFQQAYRLPTPSSGNYANVTRKVVGVKGVFCDVDFRGSDPVVLLKASPTANTGTGTCTLPVINGPNYALSVTFNEAPI